MQDRLLRTISAKDRLFVGEFVSSVVRVGECVLWMFHKNREGSLLAGSLDIIHDIC